MNDAFTPRKTISNAESTPYNTANPPSSKSERKMRENENETLKNILFTASNALEKLVEKSNQPPTQKNVSEDECFCQLIKEMLNQVPPSDMKDNLKLEIQQLILQCKRASTFRQSPNFARQSANIIRQNSNFTRQSGSFTHQSPASSVSSCSDYQHQSFPMSPSASPI